MTRASHRKKRGRRSRQNAALVSSIADIQRAALQSLWTDQPEAGTQTPARTRCGRSGFGVRTALNHVSRLREHAQRYDLTVSREEIVFIDRTILLVHGSGQNLARSNEILGAIAEVRLAKTTATFFTNMSTVDQRAWIDDLISRHAAPVDGAPYVCLLDTGINRGHPLLAAVTHDNDIHCYDPNWGPADQIGHGTPMAGLAVYGDLTESSRWRTERTVHPSHRVR